MAKLNPQGKLGRPLFKHKEIVSFMIKDEIKTGYVFVVDSYGTFEQNVEPSYDILVEEENTLYKHIPESWTLEKENNH